MWSATSTSSSCWRVRASWDTQQRLTYNPNAPKKTSLSPRSKPPSTPPSTTPLTSSSVTLSPKSVSELLKLKPSSPPRPNLVAEDTYLGCEVWLPRPPKVEKPRSQFNAATLAYIGDGIYELYARRHFLLPPLSIEEHNDRVMAIVRCEAQDALLQQLVNSNFLTKEERDILRWGRNVGSAKTRTRKRAGVAVYNRASSLETLIGHLYLTNKDRLEEIMQKMGFSTGCSALMILNAIATKTSHLPLVFDAALRSRIYE